MEMEMDRDRVFDPVERNRCTGQGQRDSTVLWVVPHAYRHSHAAHTGSRSSCHHEDS